MTSELKAASSLPRSCSMNPGNDASSILFIEPLYGGSHQQLVDLLLREFGGDLFTLPSTKWHWRMRVSALHFSLTIPHKVTYRTLFASSVLNLCELVSLRPDLRQLHKVLYFHENQLVYPVRKQQDRDFQYGYNQILSCLVADVVLFNSEFNKLSFLTSLDSFLNLIPDHRPKGLADVIRPKCFVVYFPIVLSTLKSKETFQALTSESERYTKTDGTSIVVQNEEEEKEKAIDGCQLDISNDACVSSGSSSSSQCDSLKTTLTTSRHGTIESECLVSKENISPLHILWPHRWEHDKGPDEFCFVLRRLLELELDFKVSILGSHTNDIPECFKALLPHLGSRLLHQGHQPLEDYHRILHSADVVVSTSLHEFFGVSMLEAVFCGCYPLCPNRLVYPEIYPHECLYNTEQQLFKRLKRFCQYPELARKSRAPLKDQMNMTKYMWIKLKESYSCHLTL